MPWNLGEINWVTTKPEGSFEEFFDIASGAQRRDSDVVGKQVKGKFSTKREKELYGQEARIAKQEASEGVRALPDLDKGLSGKNTRYLVMKERDRVADYEDKAWGEFAH